MKEKYDSYELFGSFLTMTEGRIRPDEFVSSLGYPDFGQIGGGLAWGVLAKWLRPIQAIR